jgi:Cu(I)/Ag(I) efflux system membrane fusion protein
MKTHTRILPLAIAALLLPFAAHAASDDGCCAKEKEKVAAGCCSSASAAPVKSAFAAPPAAPRAEGLSEADAAFLASYEKIRAALAGDNLDAAKKAAVGLEGAEEIAAAKKIGDARVAFKALSATAIAKAKGHAGFYIAHCPMVKGGGADWLTTKKKIENPYFGSAMFSCGYIKE